MLVNKLKECEEESIDDTSVDTTKSIHIPRSQSVGLEMVRYHAVVDWKYVSLQL